MDFLDQIMKGMDNTKHIGSSKPPVSVAAPKPKAASSPKEIHNGQTYRKYQPAKASPNGSPSSSPPPPEPPKKKSKVVNHKRKGSASPPHKNYNNGGNKSPERTNNTSTNKQPQRNRSKSPDAPVTPPPVEAQVSSPAPTLAAAVSPAPVPTPAPAPAPTVAKADNDDGLPICKSAPVLVETAEQCVKAINVMRRKQCKLVAIDCEAVGMNRHGKLCLVQVASNEDCFLFDIVAGGNDLFDNGLRWLLESEDIIKVVHDCRGDSEILFYQHQVTLTNVFDTQIAFCVTCRQNAGSTPIPVSLNTLIKKYARGATNQFKDIVRNEMEACDNYWERRPMTENMIQYASQDVIYLPYIYKQFDALLSVPSKKIATAMCLRYVDQYRSLPERPASPVRSQTSPSSTPTSSATSPTTPHQESTSPTTISPIVSTSASPATLEAAASPAAPSPRFVPKYGIEEWDKEISRKLEFNASKFGGYGGHRRG